MPSSVVVVQPFPSSSDAVLIKNPGGGVETVLVTGADDGTGELDTPAGVDAG